MGASAVRSRGRVADDAPGPVLISGASQEALPTGWRRWLLENKLSGTPDDSLISVLVENGFDRQTAARELASLSSCTSFQAANELRQRIKKLESMFNVRQALASLAFGAGTVERRSRISRAEFRDRYYAANRPVVLTGLMEGSAALRLWNPAYLRETVGDAMVEIMAGRNNDPRYEINSFSHKQNIRFAEYVDMILQPGLNNDIYLVANNGFFKRQEFKQLFEQTPGFPDYLRQNPTGGEVFLWFGPGGTVTPLHHDCMNVLTAQVYGRKRFTLISPDQTHLVYNNIGVYGEVDCENPDFEKHPLYRGVKPLTVELSPGEALFIPVGWWHHVRSLDVSIMLSYTNFAFPNSYEWHQPDIRS